jgi:hypothetical protein
VGPLCVNDGLHAAIFCFWAHPDSVS